MVRERPDWCISRQRDWGVPIIAFYCRSCDEILLSKPIVDHVAGIFEKEGADAWYSRETGDLLPRDTFCPKCGGLDFRKEFNILDVWFDSGSSHLAALGRRPDLPWPSDMYIEGGDQYRGWFQSSLLIGVALRGASPYRASITHGWTLDELGRAMSKSKGIGMDPSELVQQRGAEIARLLAGSVDYVVDIRIFDELMDRLSEAYRKIRNTCRYILGNLHNQQEPDHPRFDPESDLVAYDRLLEIDRWALARTSVVIRKCLKAYEDYQFHQAYTALHSFCTVDLSSFYLNILKDRLYTHASASISRRSAQTAMYLILDCLVRLLAPLLPFTCEEVWMALHAGKPDLPSIHAGLFPARRTEWEQEPLLVEWDRIMEVRESVSKALEEKRQAKTIGDSLEARVRLCAGRNLYPVLRRKAEDLRYLLIVSQVDIKEDAALEPDGLQVEVVRADGAKCERCWNYSAAVGGDATFPTLCERCLPILRDFMK